GSRTRSSSPRTAAGPAPAPPGTSWSCDPAGTIGRPERAVSVSTNDLKNGMTLELDGDLWTVLDFLHHKPGKGQAVVRTRLRNVKTGAVLDRTFKHDEKVGLAILDKSEMQYLYREGDSYVFMDNGTYEQYHVPAAVVGDAANYLTEGFSPVVSMYGGNAIGVELPAAVVLKVTRSD